MSLSKFITKNPQKIGEMRDMGINLNDFAPARDLSPFQQAIRNAVTRVQPTEIMNQPFIGRDFSQFDQAKMGQLPIVPGYNEEMDIDDTGRITLRNYLQEFGDTAKSGLENLADRGMSLFDNSQRSNLTRAGLGALLFGFNPITAALGAFTGSKGPGIVNAFQQGKFNPLKFIQEKRAEREAAKAAAERANLDAYFRGVEASGGDTSGRFDGASSMEEYSADPTGFSGSS